MRPNRMKQQLLAGEPAFGVSIMIPSPQLVEMVARLGFDWILIDCEHGTINAETVELLVMAAEGAQITPIARPQTRSPKDILQVMERGAHGVQVPHVNTAEQARQAVRAVKYAPLGNRGMAAGTRPADYGLGVTVSDYVESANRETLICVQLEEEEAVRNAGEILQVENIDVFFVGPSDLSQSMGHAGHPKAPPVQQATRSTFEKTLAAGKIPGTVANQDGIRDVLKQGVLYTYTHVPKLLGSGAEAFFDAARS